MGLHNRPYMQDDGDAPAGGGGMSLGLPRATPAVKCLLIINAAVFVAQMFLDHTTMHGFGAMTAWLGVTVRDFWQMWRYITFQFLHAGVWHIMLNMLGLYFLGTALEQLWGSRKFLTFYLSCGVAAGAAYVVIGALGHASMIKPIIGASGGVYGVLLACAVLFPHFRIIFLFFPVPIRLAAVIIFGAMLLTVMQALSYGQAYEAMSDVAHLGGAVAAAGWLFLPRFVGIGVGARRPHQGDWERKQHRRAEEQARKQAEIDRILTKIHDQGLASLTAREKRTLQDASKQQCKEEGPY